MVRWLVDVEVQPADEPPFAAGCDLSLLDAYSVSPGEPVTVAYHAESKRCDHIVDVEDQRRGGEPVAAAHGLRATGVAVGLGRVSDDPPQKRSRAPDLRPQRRAVPLGGAVGLGRAVATSPASSDAGSVGANCSPPAPPSSSRGLRWRDANFPLRNLQVHRLTLLPNRLRYRRATQRRERTSS